MHNEIIPGNKLAEEINTLLGLKIYDRPALKKAYIAFDMEMRKGEDVGVL
jgi:hypothetical protein